MPFANLGLRPELVNAVISKGYRTPSPIQEKAIPAILEGRDVLGGAQTGTGKTAAFSLPLLQLLAESNFKTKRARALVLAPTRELAAQVHQSILDYGDGLDLRSKVIFGGVGFQPQINAFRRGLDIIVATPGRLLDLCQRGDANLSGIEYLVLDEADRMLDMGFIHDIRKILDLIPNRKQTLFFSATYSQEVKRLADSILRDPVEVEVSPRNSTAERVDQEAYLVGQKAKRERLSTMIIDGNWHQVLVFTRTKHGANRLATQLEKDDIPAMAIHGNKSQSARERALANFKSNRIQVLVATDIAARGLDISELPYVVNYELPNVPEDYVHRIGRTGRAGKAGKAISLVGESEEEYLLAIEKLLKKSIPLFKLTRNGERLSIDSSSLTPPKRKNRESGPPTNGGIKAIQTRHRPSKLGKKKARRPSLEDSTQRHSKPSPKASASPGPNRPPRRSNRWRTRKAGV